MKSKKAKTIALPYPPINTSGYAGHFDVEDGFYVEWLGTEIVVVIRKDGVDYKQGVTEFIENCTKKSNDGKSL